MTKKKRLYLTEESWLIHYNRWKNSNETLSSYARKHNINNSTFSKWKNRFLLKNRIKRKTVDQNFSAFQEAEITNSNHTQDSIETEIKFHFPNGCYLSFHKDFDEVQLYRILTNWIE